MWTVLASTAVCRKSSCRWTRARFQSRYRRCTVQDERITQVGDKGCVRLDPVVTQRPYEGHSLPVAIWGFVDEPAAAPVPNWVRVVIEFARVSSMKMRRLSIRSSTILAWRSDLANM